jgi:ribosomal protein S18 acetylase RimI-like enzyme
MSPRLREMLKRRLLRTCFKSLRWCMPIEVVIRRPQPHEYDSLRDLIEIVATETFKDLFAPNPVPLKFEDDDWPLAWVATSGTKILGVIITHQEWVDDLWVLQEYRGQGVGKRLLAQGESEIVARGCQTRRLRVVESNLVAVRFYARQGWRIAREFAHEKYGHPMLEMSKSFPLPQQA